MIAADAREGPRTALRLAACFLAASGLTWVRLIAAGSLRVDGAPLAVRAGFSLAFGVCAAMAAIFYLRLVERPGELRPLLGPALALHACAALALPLTSNDVFSNLATGRMLWRGLNPYRWGPGRLGPSDSFASLVGERWLDVPTPYGPVALLANGAAAATAHVAAALAVYKLELLLASLALVLLAYRFCSARLSPPRAASTFALVALNPLLAWEVSAQAHNDGLMLVALAGFAWAALDARWLLAVACAAVAIDTKLAALPLLVLFLAHVARRSPGRALLLLLFAGTLVSLLFAPFWAGPASLRSLLEAASASPLKVTRSFAALADLAVEHASWPVRNGCFRAVWALGTAVVLWVFARGVLRARSMAQALHDGILVFLATCLFAPWFHPWYATWVLPLALFARDARLLRVVALYTALSVTQYALPLEPLTTVLVDLVALRALWPFLVRGEPLARAASQIS